MTNQRRATWWPLLALLMMGVSPALRAQDDSSAEPPELSDEARLERARELYDNGARLYEEGRYEAAILAFEEARMFVDAPLLLYNIANAYERLGELELAVDYLDQYRAYAPSDEAESISQRVRSLERRIEAQEEASTESDDLVLAPDQVEPASALEPAPEPAAGGIRPVHWALGATAVVGLATGITFGVLSGNSRDAFEAACVEVDGARVCPDSASDDYDAWRRQSIVADVGFGIAAAATIALVLVVLVADDSEERPAISFAPWAAPATVGISLSGGL